MNTREFSTRPLAPKPLAAAGRFKRIDGGHARWANQAYRSGPLLHADGARLDWQAGGHWTPHASLRLMAGSERLTLQLESLPALASFLTGPFDAWPEEEWCLLVEIAAAPLLDLLVQALRQPLSVAQVHIGLLLEPAPAPPRAGLSFAYRRCAAAPPVHGRLVCERPAALALAPCPDEGWERWHGLPLPLRLGCGQARIAARALARVRVGDVLRSSVAMPADPPQFALLLGERTIALVRPGIDPSFRHHLEIASMSTTSHEAAGSEDIGEMDAIGEIAVDVRYEIGGQSLTLKELNGLRLGLVIPLGFDPLQACVTIRANGTVVGQGELVVVDEELAVRITRWTAAAHA